MAPFVAVFLHWVWNGMPLMVVLLTAAPCLNKDLYANGYEKETWIKSHSCLNTNANVSIHVKIM